MDDLVHGSYDVIKESWYSPKEVIEKFELIRSVFKDAILNHEFKRAREMFTCAVALLGAYELSPENKYWLQSNNQSSSPDVMAAAQFEQEAGILLSQTQMEVVELEEHAKITDIVEFLQSTKLSPLRGYDEYMMIVLVVNRFVPFNHREIHERLKKIRPKPTIYILGRPQDASFGTFTLFTPYPGLTRPFRYDVVETAKKYSIPPRINFHLATDKKVSYKKEIMTGISAYDTLGLDKEKIEKKYKIA